MSKSAQRRLLLIAMLSELDGSTSSGLVCALQTTRTKAQKVEVVPEMESFPHPFKDKLSNSWQGCTAQKENQQELAPIPAQGPRDF